MESNHLDRKEETHINDFPLKSIQKEVNGKIIEQLAKPFADNKEELADEFKDNIDYDVVNTPAKVDAMDEYSKEFIQRTKEGSGSKKLKFTITDALLVTTKHTKRDECFILTHNYLAENPPEKNDLIKYIISYSTYGKKLKQKYCKYDIEIFEKYYKKADEMKKNGDSYSPFNIKAYRNYVFYMVLKLQGQYIDADNELFNVSVKDNREYNPATKIPSILRGFLPIDIKEYDIKRAFPTFIDMELGTDYRHTIYEILDKKTFAQLLNANWPVRNDDYFYKCIEKLEKVYGSRAFDVLTSERFSEKGRAFRDFAKYEKEFVEQFIKENNEN